MSGAGAFEKLLHVNEQVCFIFIFIHIFGLISPRKSDAQTPQTVLTNRHRNLPLQCRIKTKCCQLLPVYPNRGNQEAGQRECLINMFAKEIMTITIAHNCSFYC